MKKKRSIVIVEPFSTGFNLIDDVRARDYQPVAVVAPSLGTDEDRETFHQVKEMFLIRLPDWSLPAVILVWSWLHGSPAI